MVYKILAWSFAGLILLNCGCNNRCQSPGGCGPFANTRVPSPGTGRLQMPNRSAANQPYYVPGNPNSLAAAAQPLNTAQGAPTLAANNALNGWQQIPTNLPNRGPSSPPQYNSNPATIASTNGLPAGYRVASATTMPDRSFTDSTPYQSTPSDDRRDPTRLPATDATAVRPPANAANFGFQPANAGPRFSANLNVAQPITPPQNTLAGAGDSRYQSPYIRNNAQIARTGNLSSVGTQVGWNPRGNDQSSNR